jgi:hypothetical protein
VLAPQTGPKHAHASQRIPLSAAIGRTWDQRREAALLKRRVAWCASRRGGTCRGEGPERATSAGDLREIAEVPVQDLPAARILGLRLLHLLPSLLPYAAAVEPHGGPGTWRTSGAPTRSVLQHRASPTQRGCWSGSRHAHGSCNLPAPPHKATRWWLNKFIPRNSSMVLVLGSRAL